jgi:dynein light chain Tctex-type 1
VTFSALKAEIQGLVKEKVATKLSDKAYKAEQVNGWCEEIIREILREGAKEQFQPFKYLANCLVLWKRYFCRIRKTTAA